MLQADSICGGAVSQAAAPDSIIMTGYSGANGRAGREQRRVVDTQPQHSVFGIID